MANEKRLIDANALIADIAKAQDELITNNDALWQINQKYYKGLAWAHRLALDAPTVDAVEVTHGQWEIEWQYERDHTGEFDEWPVATCPFCGHKEYGFAYDKGWSKPYNYCPNCGAKMDGGDEGV